MAEPATALLSGVLGSQPVVEHPLAAIAKDLQLGVEHVQFKRLQAETVRLLIPMLDPPDLGLQPQGAGLVLATGHRQGQYVHGLVVPGDRHEGARVEHQIVLGDGEGCLDLLLQNGNGFLESARRDQVR